MSLVNRAAEGIGGKIAKAIDFNDNQKEILIYMFKLIIKNSFMWISVFIITMILGTWWSTFVFMLTFMAIRYSFGGWHSKNEYICFIISIIVPVAIGYITKLMTLNLVTFFSIYVIAIIIALGVGVVDNPTKRLSQEKKVRFKRRGLIILTTVFALNVLSLILNFNQFTNAMSLGVFIGFTNLLFGK